ncbi:hypothetical protein SODALDRAFT_330491 [Sodiomyces alkalinus F11]|uniref:Transcription factor IIIC 90kDa subunit N-terminal domain-containing protein n=1 Tax=Sodiomyces alkalinus (strain CBS 110278 / VKM F-3762 / F11) TaxID=1314773 RepID=A0A3N2Q1W4_SODAK|nr:hypothetical protein SODALDRAFT_330491 [Sodiomyces alkalinus F11]ROT40749.1 hypothetical protein SODALDRAFT_330491 [Sodiomyces alkalinus F11]
MDHITVPLLATVTLKSRPLNPHSLAISCDAELAVAADDSVHILLPEFPVPTEDPDLIRARQRKGADDENDEDADSDGYQTKQYHTYRTQFATSKKPDPRANLNLFESAGIRFPPSESSEEPQQQQPYYGVGKSLPTGWGSAISQTVSLAWSPTGLGYNLRPVLAILLTNGSIVVCGQDPAAVVADGGEGVKTFDAWRLLWAVGDTYPLPDRKARGGSHLPRDKIMAFSWAHEIAPGRALLAYRSHREDLAILRVDFFESDRFKGRPSPWAWRVEEVARFKNDGPHPPIDVMHPDFVPHGSAFGLKWSPWLLEGDKRISILAHHARSYVGFRRITVPVNWERGQRVSVTVEEFDLLGICVNLRPESFVEWEDAIWTVGDKKICRGVIATPFEAKPFRIVVNAPAPAREALPTHPTHVCKTTYPEDCMSSNPITGLIIYPPENGSDHSSGPYYSLVRMSAIGSNTNWFQENKPLLPTETLADDDHQQDQDATASSSSSSCMPQWAEIIANTVNQSIPKALASRRHHDSDSEGGDEEDGVGQAELGDIDAEGEEDDEEDDEFDFDDLDENTELVNPWRVRIWDLAAWPGGGMTAVLMSQHSTLGPETKIRTKVLFAPCSRRKKGVDHGGGGGGGGDAAVTTVRRLTTEARMWEWMYGGGPPVPGTVTSGDEVVMPQDLALREAIKPVIEAQRCLFCQGVLSDTGRYSVCEMKHSFATCSATGLAILAPGISRACGVCGRRCLTVSKIREAAEKQGVSLDDSRSFGEACGICGGKFIA